jgi:cytochrome P450
LTANIILLFGAGHETTVNLIGNGLLALHRNPDQLALLKSSPALVTNAIEEFLRYDSSVQLTGRVALEDIDDLGGKKIPKGESVLCLLGSANRDPAVYPDRPDRLDITRPNVRPLSFSCGWTTPRTRNGGRPSCCAASRHCRQAGEGAGGNPDVTLL